MKEEYITILPSDPRYPEAVKTILFNTTLYAVGDLSLLDQRAIGICGSRNASAEAQNWALKFGREAAKRDLVVVSGYARGIDRQAHKGALEAGGRTIAVIPEGIASFRVIHELEPFV